MASNIEYRPEVGELSVDDESAIEAITRSYGNVALIVGRDLDGELLIELAKREKPRRTAAKR